MKAVRKTSPEPGVRIEQVNAPRTLGPNDVLVEVAAAGICGSDVHVYEWTSGYDFMRDKLPLTLGHEFAGRVIERGAAVTTIDVGARVTVWPSSGCGNCAPCRRGEPENCLQKSTLGLMRDGGFARHVVVPEKACFSLPDGLDLDLAALTEPLCVGAQAVDVGQVRFGDTVVVLGPGTIGQAIAQFARKAGAAKVIMVGFNDGPRLAVCEALGFGHRIDLAEQELAATVSAIAGGPVDCVFEATGVAASIRDGLGLLRKGGVLVTTGIHARPVEVDLTDFVRRKLQLRGSHGSRPAIWEKVLRVLGESGESFRPMITHRLPLDEAVEGFELARRKEASKVMLMPQDD
ncbi:zinc-dependent alcohol dehydrogenase [Rhodoligotrophos ferricapiens]|uniref:zinc-dependent alcohol dehydrogenase n=1 Tax=Rhodoligotrophos ferricapiens TaxID=3069264 RepID=UPI00315DD608